MYWIFAIRIMELYGCRTDSPRHTPRKVAVNHRRNKTQLFSRIKKQQMKTIILALAGTVLVGIMTYLLISFLVWQINPVMWGVGLTTVGAIYRMTIMIFAIIYFTIKIGTK